MRELGLKCVKFMRKSHKYNAYKGKYKCQDNYVHFRLFKNVQFGLID